MTNTTNMTMSSSSGSSLPLEQRQVALISSFSGLEDWEKKYRHLIELGKALPPFPEEQRREDLKVKGCQSQVWLWAKATSDKRVEFLADSDALIVKGLVALLLQLYSGASADEILKTPPHFIKDLGLDQHLSPSRANGLVAMVKQIKYYAAAFKALGQA